MANYRAQILADLDALPDQYLPFAAQLIRTFRESVTLSRSTPPPSFEKEPPTQDDPSLTGVLWDGIDYD